MHDLWQGLLIVNDKIPHWGRMIIALALVLFSLLSMYGRLDLRVGGRLFKKIPDHEIRTNWSHIIRYTIIPMILTVFYLALLAWGGNLPVINDELSSRLDSVRFEQSDQSDNKWTEQRDLDGDGRISFYEDQLSATQFDNYSNVGYPFARIFQSGEVPTLIPRFRLNIAKIRQSLSRKENSFTELFGHPKLMDDFLAKYLDTKCEVCINGIVFAEDDYLAFTLTDRKTKKVEMICLDKVTPLGVKSIERWR